ncbi:hypothetical protein [Actinoplanes utahensis]|uniref:hypothetical protein n=1 Tax=Actinoplanes utahensis TaxID=1869 RepID=UPI000689C5FD|nr:hypothetical protein [Actinoplanes utahensis]GIF34576.1 hypothetical protein Aut01nite_75620 [Actinoplanes utahensis]
MTGAHWPVADERLERHYRRLLLAYPRSYRRQHGTEIVTTLLEMAEPGRRRPAAGEAWHLLASGVQQRFRVPRRSLAVLAAVLVAVTLGAFGAAAGSWAGERTFAELPSETAANELVAIAVENPDESGVGHPRETIQPNQWNEPGLAGRVHLTALLEQTQPGPTPMWTVEQTRDRLAAAGWTITEFTVRPLNPEPPEVLAARGTHARYEHLRRAARLTAERDGLVLYGQVTDAIGPPTLDNLPPGVTMYNGVLEAAVFARRTGEYLPLTVAGGVLAGWLLVAGLTYRTRGSRSRHRTAAVLTGLALAVASLPVYVVLVNAALLVWHAGDRSQPVRTLYDQLLPGDSLGVGPPWLMVACVVSAAVAATAAVFVASTGLGRRDAAVQPG